jgi:ADP-ribosylglycohydrolase
MIEAARTERIDDLSNRVDGALLGSWIGDALAMPVHWYYDRSALEREYGLVTDYKTPKNPHPDSILWRSHWVAPSPELDILGDQRRFWGERGVHYHQNLRAGENTLTIKVAAEAWRSLEVCGVYDGEDFLRRYVEMMLRPEHHHDTYVEECHREFFTNLGRGRPLEKCSVEEKHISGLVMMLPVALFHANREDEGRACAMRRLALTHAGRKMRIAAEAILALLYPVLKGASLEEAIRLECASQRNPHFGSPFFKWLKADDRDVIGRRLSTACYVEDAVPAVIYLALKYSGRPEEGLIANTNLGGDNAHRGGVLGALLGAENGVAGWPERWVEGLLAPPV